MIARLFFIGTFVFSIRPALQYGFLKAHYVVGLGGDETGSDGND